MHSVCFRNSHGIESKQFKALAIAKLEVQLIHVFFNALSVNTRKSICVRLLIWIDHNDSIILWIHNMSNLLFLPAWCLLFFYEFLLLEESFQLSFLQDLKDHYAQQQTTNQEFWSHVCFRLIVKVFEFNHQVARRSEKYRQITEHDEAERGRE